MFLRFTTAYSRLAMLSLAAMLAQAVAPAQEPGQASSPSAGTTDPVQKSEKEPATQLATFGGGCFWCVEAVFENVRGVTDVDSGYSGGRTRNPSYKQVCSGRTGHAEVCQIHFDPQQISYAELLEIFWKTHDPTTLNRQGPDTGTQYRSVIFYHSPEQKSLAEKYKQKLDEAGAFPSKIVTEITKAQTFYPAEAEHQDFYRLNPRYGYCAAIVAPKVEKFKQAFSDKVAEPGPAKD